MSPAGSPADDAERPPQEPRNLEQLLARLGEAAQDDAEVTLGRLVDTVGRRSFGPLLLLAGLIALSPLSGIPGMPTTMALLVAVIAGQLLVGRPCFWLPDWVTRRRIPRPRLQQALGALQRPATFVDRFLRPRLTGLTGGAGSRLVAVLCLLIAATMPPLEPLPFMASTAGLALTAFGLALIAHDGLLALLATGVTAGGAGLALGQLL